MIDKETLKLVLEALEMADEMIDTVCVPNAITAIKQARAASVQEPVAWRWVPSKVWQDYVLSDDPQKAALARKHGIEVEALCKCTTPPAQPTPDLQAELEATNRQVEILSDALAESRREIARLKAVQEPVAQYSDIVSDGGFDPRNKFDIPPAQQEYERCVIDGMQRQAQSSVDKAVNAMSQRQWVGLTEHELESLWYQAETGGAMLLRFAEAIEAKLKEKNT
jgi:hypothetical protein